MSPGTREARRQKSVGREREKEREWERERERQGKGTGAKRDVKRLNALLKCQLFDFQRSLKPDTKRGTKWGWLVGWKVGWLVPGLDGWSCIFPAWLPQRQRKNKPWKKIHAQQFSGTCLFFFFFFKAQTNRFFLAANVKKKRTCQALFHEVDNC